MRHFVWIISAALLVGAVGCENSATPKTEAPTPPAAGGESPKVEEKPAQAMPAEEKKEAVAHYEITADALSLTVGAAGELAIVVKPSPGFKVNEEFPWKATLAAPATMKVDGEAGSDKWALSKESAALKVPVTADAAGDGEIKAKLNFSVCDENACEVIRDKEVAIKVAAK